MRYTWDHTVCNINIELGTRETVEKEERFSTMTENVIDRHCNQVNTNWVIPTNCMRYLHTVMQKQLGTNYTAYQKWFTNATTVTHASVSIIIIIIIIIIITAFVSCHKVQRYRGDGGIRLRLSKQMGLEVSFEGVYSITGSNVRW